MTHRLFTAALICAMTAAAPSLAADFTMKIASPAPLNDKDALSAWFTAFEAGVETRSEGRIDVQLFPGGQLGPIPATVEGVAMGTIEVTVPIIGFLSSLDPRCCPASAHGRMSNPLLCLPAVKASWSPTLPSPARPILPVSSCAPAVRPRC